MSGPQQDGRGVGKLTLMPISYGDACMFIGQHHRHHAAPQGHKYSIAVTEGQDVVGVIMVGRPVSRHQDDGLTLEVTRCCVVEGVPNACSMLYGAAWRAARPLGYQRLITYTLPSEGGASLRAAGWRVIGQTQGGEWSRPSRPRPQVRQPGQKTLWEAPA